MVHMFHSFNHFRRKSTVRNSMVIFVFLFAKSINEHRQPEKKKRMKRDVFDVLSGLNFCLSKCCLCLLMMVAVRFFCAPYTNGLKMSLKVTNSDVVVYVIYAWFFSPIWFMESTLFTIYIFGIEVRHAFDFDDHKVDQTMDHRTPKMSSKPEIVDGFFSRRKEKKSHEYFHFLWFFVNETVHWFSFGPCPRNHHHQHRKSHFAVFKYLPMHSHNVSDFSLTKDNNRMCKAIYVLSAKSHSISEIVLKSTRQVWLCRSALGWLICTSQLFNDSSSKV